MTKLQFHSITEKTLLTQALRNLSRDLSEALKSIPYDDLVTKIKAIQSNSGGKSAILKLQSAIIDAKHKAKEPSATPTTEEKAKAKT